MKKFIKILIPIMVLLVAIFGLSGVASADDPTTVTINWVGDGVIAGGVNTGDTISSFTTGANAISGFYTATDSNDNPYGYSVDSFGAEFVSHVSGGSTTYTVLRTSSYPMYGAAGQNTYSFIGASPDGYADMAMYTVSNYAAMQEANYGHVWTPGGDTFTADAASFVINHYVYDSEGDFSQILSQGSGSAKIDAMSSDLATGSLTFAKGAGCYTDASFDGNGTQSLQFISSGHTSVNQLGFNVPGNGSVGSAYLNILFNFVGGFNIPDFSASVN